VKLVANALAVGSSLDAITPATQSAIAVSSVGFPGARGARSDPDNAAS